MLGYMAKQQGVPIEDVVDQGLPENYRFAINVSDRTV